MNQGSSLIGITINNTGKAVGTWWSNTSTTFMAGGVEELKKHLFMYCLLCTLTQALSKLELLVGFKKILLFLYPLFTSCKSIASF